VRKRPEIVAKSLGKRIRELRAKKGWSQERLADESGLHRSYMWGVEQGRRNPSLRNLARIADALELALSELFSGV
jgi:transcriptional regulator with XRE-family HTH domain